MKKPEGSKKKAAFHSPSFVFSFLIFLSAAANRANGAQISTQRLSGQTQHIHLNVLKSWTKH